MSIEETGRPAPLLQTLGDPAAAVCVDGFCAVPETDADTPNTSATNTSATNADTKNTTNTRGAGK